MLIHKENTNNNQYPLNWSKREVWLIFDSRQLSPFRIRFKFLWDMWPKRPSTSIVWEYTLSPDMYFSLKYNLGTPQKTVDQSYFKAYVYDRSK